MEKIKEELDPECHEEYEEVVDFTIDNMTLPFFYNRIFGTHPYDGTENKTFWEFNLEHNDNSNITVGNKLTAG